MVPPSSLKSDPKSKMQTEKPHPESTRLQEMALPELMSLMSREDFRACQAVQDALDSLARSAEVVAECYIKGSTTFFVGAGTSGRTCAMEVAELPPTFGVDPSQFIALTPTTSFKEAGEDDIGQAREIFEKALSQAGEGEHVIIGVSASGQTPFVLEVIHQAKIRGIQTIGIANNEGAPLLTLADLKVFLNTGPEIIAGSTRLKAGTAQKMALNHITVGAMVLCGRTHKNLMAYVTPVNQKLRQRAIAIVCAELHVDEETARCLLTSADWSVPKVLGLE